MESDNQIFIRIDTDSEPVEFLLLEQAVEMIRADVVTKKQIRETVEMGFQHPDEIFSTVIQYRDYRLLLYITVKIDIVLQTVKKVEQHIE